MWGDIAIAFVLAFITSYVIIPYSMRLARKVNAVDKPEARRINKVVMPRLGGLGIIAGFFVSMIYLIISMELENKTVLDEYHWKIIGLFIGLVIIGLVGLVDDCKQIKPILKLLGQTVAAAVVMAFGITIGDFNLPIIDKLIELNGIMEYIITWFWIVGITNAINLTDGLDGLSSGITLIACVSLLIIFAINGSPIISIILITALAGGIVGFLPFNVNPAKTYMGDCGSNFLGFSISIISILGIAKTYTILVIIAPLIVLALPIFDTVFAVIRRIAKGKSIKAIFQPDNGHLHHKLMKLGYSQKEAVLILYGVATTLGMFAIILIESGIWKAISFALLIIAIFAIGYNDILRKNKD
ncbi:MAG: undecaprenyl/decaprenyl-phosphate alpha-N-acetylglucosaminyl 1-phosphate transferase [Clostridia bacterium]|nr:undecaprenyl/decaprenyl-phosphate alpha-N-acetylglucosaminyl 1-phosphate transferase [Clostridia bacterium]